jgi:hypothetical protein
MNLIAMSLNLCRAFGPASHFIEEQRPVTIL